MTYYAVFMDYDHSFVREAETYEKLVEECAPCFEYGGKSITLVVKGEKLSSSELTAAALKRWETMKDE